MLTWLFLFSFLFSLTYCPSLLVFFLIYFPLFPYPLLFLLSFSLWFLSDHALHLNHIPFPSLFSLCVFLTLPWTQYFLLRPSRVCENFSLLTSLVSALSSTLLPDSSLPCPSHHLSDRICASYIWSVLLSDRKYLNRPHQKKLGNLLEDLNWNNIFINQTKFIKRSGRDNRA